MVKVFGIGLNKTGTSTLAACGRILGYKSTSCDRTLLEDVVMSRDFSRVNEIAAQYDLFEDWPWPLIYKEMDQMFPGSKFVLTVRKDEMSWYESLKKHSLRTNPASHCRKLAYGYAYPHSYKNEHLTAYKTHNATVKEYFRDRQDDFIELCWESGDGWEELCKFLGHPIPQVAFPHANRGTDQNIKLSWRLMNEVLRRVPGW